MSNEEKALELFPDVPTMECLCKGVREKLIKMAEWKDKEFEWHECMHNMAIKQNLTNKEFREMLEKMPDDALVCVECCHPRAMVYDEKYNLIRID